MKQKLVIIGAGLSGVEAASRLSSEYDVALLSEEQYLPYYRIRVGEVVTGLPPESLYIHPESWYREKNIDLIFKKAERIDNSKKAVYLSDGSSIPYDILILSTGSYPFVPSFEGKHKALMTLRTMDDALKLRAALQKASSIVIVGGGVLGLEAAVSIKREFQIDVSVIESADYILSRMIDKDSALFLSSLLEKEGIKLITNGKVKDLASSSVILEDSTIDCDIVLFSTGVRARVELCKAIGIEVDRGIVVDSYLKSNIDSIYALGDAAELRGKTFGQAQYAREMARSLLSGSAYVPSSPSSMLKVAGIDVASFGVFRGIRHSIKGEDSLKSYFVEDGIITGAVLINSRSEMAKAKAAIGKPFSNGD